MSETKTKPILTVIEVLIALAIFFVVVSLVVISIDDTKRRFHDPQCKNNLRQLSIAAQNFHSTRSRLPGYVQPFGVWQPSDMPPVPADPNADASTMAKHQKVGTWAVCLLPFLDQQPLYDIWSSNKYPIAFGGSSQHPVSSGSAGVGFNGIAVANVSVFQCPAVPQRKNVTARNNYACNVGFYASVDSADFERSMSPANGLFNNQFAGTGPDGISVLVPPAITLDDIVDGQSQTLMFAENVQAMPWHRAGFIDAKDLVLDDDQDTVAYEPTSRYTQGITWHRNLNDSQDSASNALPIHRINSTVEGVALEDLEMTASNASDLARPSSLHAGGVNIALADGSIHFLSETVDYRVYQSLLAPDDKNSEAHLNGWTFPNDTLK